MAVIPLINGSHMRTVKEAFLCACSIHIDKPLATYISGHLVFTKLIRNTITHKIHIKNFKMEAVVLVS